MSFPTTRHTLINRISSDRDSPDWREFLDEYWRPLFQFAARWGGLDFDDAEDVAAVTLQAVIQNELLERWTLNRRARLRTLLCAVARNVISAGHRKDRRRTELAATNRELLRRLSEFEGTGQAEVSPEMSDVFDQAWAADMLRSAVESVCSDYHREDRGDYFRVLYGRLCDQMTSREIADSLDIPLTSAENFYRHARNRVSDVLRQQLSDQVDRYADDASRTEELESEWHRLSEILEAQGGLEEAVREALNAAEGDEISKRQDSATTDILIRIQDQEHA